MGTPFGEGDVVGIHLFLPPGGQPRLRQREAVFWGKKVFWMEEPLAEEPRQLDGSFIAFYVNGAKQGEVHDILEGTYHPCLSPFTLPGQREPVVVRCNFSSELHFQPQGATVCQPWTDVAV
jgi:Set1/Ash2 histone methyltransferase complex subunit ASH2